MNLVRVGDIMVREVICVSKMAKPSDIEHLIRRCDIGEVTHHAFPVVDEEIPGKLRGKKLRGLISLDDLRLAIHSESATGSTNKRRQKLMQGTASVVRFELTDFTEEVTARLCDWLVHVPLMHDLSRGVLEQIALGMRRGAVHPGEDIIHVGEPGEAMYFLEAGSADAFVRDVSVFSYMDTGKFFGELALLTDEPRKATVRAGVAGATVWKLDRAIFEVTLSLNNRDVNLLKYADRSPITTAPHAKVARAFEIFRKLGMRHMCVADGDNNLVGMVTRKDLMTYKIVENIMTPRAEAVIRGWVYNFRARKAAEAAAQASPKKGGGNAGGASPRLAPVSARALEKGMALGVQVGKWEVNARLHQSGNSRDVVSSPSPVKLQPLPAEALQPAPPETLPPVARTPRNNATVSEPPSAALATGGASVDRYMEEEELLTALAPPQP